MKKLTTGDTTGRTDIRFRSVQIKSTPYIRAFKPLLPINNKTIRSIYPFFWNPIKMQIALEAVEYSKCV